MKIINYKYDYYYTSTNIKTCQVTPSCELEVSHTPSGSGN